jgi:transposase
VRTRDARRLGQAAQEELRRRAVALVGEGRSQTEVAGLLDVSRQSVSEWVRAQRLGGDEALAAGKRGRRPGEKTALTASQQAQIAKAIREKNPDQLKLPGFLWTRALVCELIDRRYGIRVAEKTAGRYLRAWGFSPQKPARRAFEQNPEIVARWLDERYPAIKERAHREKALILWADEMGLRSDHTAGRSWSPVGETPVIEGTGQRFGANVISAISNKGHLSFRVFKEKFVADVFIDFLHRLLRQSKGQKIILILDGHPVHRAKKVKLWVEAHAEQIELQFLPGYAPELNPTELLNQDVKTNALGRRRPHTQDELIGETRSYRRSRQRTPRVVARYFEEKQVSYAKAA